jgi:hypothetical protein
MDAGDDRTRLDEALFSEAMSFSPAGAPAVPEEVVQHTLRGDEPRPYPLPPPPCAPAGCVVTDTLPGELLLPPVVSYRTEDSPASEMRSVIGGASYELAGLAPGVFEMRQAGQSPGRAAEPVPPPDEPDPPTVAEQPALAVAEEAVADEHPLAPDPEPLPFAEEPEDRYYFLDPPADEPEEALHLPEENVWAEACARRVEPEEPAGHEEAEEAPAVELAPLPPRPVPVLAACTGLTLLAGEATALTPEHLRLTGGEPHLLDVMVLSAPLHGALLRDGFALTGGDVFTQEDIDNNRLSYRHDGGAEERDGFTFATPEGDVPATVFPLTVQPTRQAPVLSGDGQLATVLDGCRARDVLDGLATCCEPALQAGVAVVAASGRGTWQFSRDGGTTWTELGDVSHSQARLLAPDDSLRFVPRPGWSGAVKLTYRAWDRTTGQPGEVVNLSPRSATGGATAFSRATAQAVTTVAAPLVQLGGAVEPWAGTPTVAELVGDGLAVVRLAGEGKWQFSLDDGRTWRDFGAVYHGRAWLLRGGDRVRFKPRRGASGNVVLSGRLWDGHGGSPGQTVALGNRRSYGDGTPFGELVQTCTWQLGDG